MDLFSELDAIHRQVDLDDVDGDTVRVLLRRRYPTEPADLWSALTEPERVARWFMPLQGDLREGGNFRLEGNASGDILTCTPPQLLRVTFGHETSVVELRLQADGDETVLELEHTVPLAMAGSAAGALFVGPGWDGAVTGLALHVRGEAIGDPVEMASSPEVIELNRLSIDRWVAVTRASGAATAEEIEAGRQAALAQFVPGASGS
jgi:uncharacterized protein YndB with AHSA1/START domain